VTGFSWCRIGSSGWILAKQDCSLPWNLISGSIKELPDLLSDYQLLKKKCFMDLVINGTD
jgi:hypothetical protein